MSIIIKDISEKRIDNKIIIDIKVLDEEKRADDWILKRHNYIRQDDGHDILTCTIESAHLSNIKIDAVESAILFCLPKALIFSQDLVCEYPSDPLFNSNLKFLMKRLVTIPKKLHPLWKYHVLQAKKNLHEINLSLKDGEFEDFKCKDRVGWFFSGGIDAIHTGISVKELTDAIHCVGNPANFPLTETNLFLLKKIRPDVALHKVYTPLYDFTEWFYNSHGCFLGGVGSLFSNLLTSIFINGTEGLEDTDSGSGCPIDHLFSNSKMRFFSYGHSWKVKKYEFIKNNLHKDVILTNGQCCPVPKNNLKKNSLAKNCSFCAECILNMLDLYSLDLEFSSTMFDWKFFDKWLYDKVKTEPKHHPHFYQVLPMKAQKIKHKNKKMANRLIYLYNKFVEKLLEDHPDLADEGLVTLTEIL